MSDEHIPNRDFSKEENELLAGLSVDGIKAISQALELYGHTRNYASEVDIIMESFIEDGVISPMKSREFFKMLNAGHFRTEESREDFLHELFGAWQSLEASSQTTENVKKELVPEGIDNIEDRMAALADQMVALEYEWNEEQRWMDVKDRYDVGVSEEYKRLKKGYDFLEKEFAKTPEGQQIEKETEIAIKQLAAGPIDIPVDIVSNNLPKKKEENPKWYTEEYERLSKENNVPNHPFIDADLDNPSVVKAIRLDPTLSEDQKDKILNNRILGPSIAIPLGEALSKPEFESLERNGMKSAHELMECNSGPSFINGRLNINENELLFMMSKYAEMGAESRLTKPWEGMSGREKREEFFYSLQNDLAMFANTSDENKFNYVIGKALNQSDPMQGFYQTVLVKNGAFMDRDGAIEVSNAVRNVVSDLGRRSLQVKDLVYLNSQERQQELERMDLGKSLRLNV